MTQGITSQKAAEAVGSRFDLVLIASARARELKRGYKALVPNPTGYNVTALREVEAGFVGREYLKKKVAQSQANRR